MIDDCTAIVLAGGESRRMGCDKATFQLDGQTLLNRVLAIVQPLFPRVLVSVRQPRPDIDWPQIVDPHDAAGPLAGLYAGLAHASAERTPWIFAVATDMPFVKPALIEHLARRRDNVQAVIPVVQGHPQALAGFYSATCLETVRAVLAGNGKHSLRSALEQLDVCYVDESELTPGDPGLSSFFDLDTPQDVADALGRKAPV